MAKLTRNLKRNTKPHPEFLYSFETLNFRAASRIADRDYNVWANEHQCGGFELDRHRIKRYRIQQTKQKLWVHCWGNYDTAVALDGEKLGEIHWTHKPEKRVPRMEVTRNGSQWLCGGLTVLLTARSVQARLNKSIREHEKHVAEMAARDRKRQEDDRKREESRRRFDELMDKLDMQVFSWFGFESRPTQPELTRAYRKLAIEHHPDKGGEKAAFQELRAKYEKAASILQDVTGGN